MASINTLAPASILYCGLLMFGITLAFIHLNKVIVNAGASYAWVSQIFNPFLGFFTGWTLLVSSTVFMVSGSIPAATATLLLVAPDLVSNPHWVMLIATAWLTLITLITLKGIKTSSRVQIFMTGLEVLILVAIILGGIFFFYKHPAHVFSIAWLSLFNFSPSLFATGALTALFLYWGWDVTLNLSEETKNKQYTPGWGAFWAVIIIILLFVCFSITVLLVLTDTEIQASGTNIIFELPGCSVCYSKYHRNIRNYSSTIYTNPVCKKPRWCFTSSICSITCFLEYPMGGYFIYLVFGSIVFSFIFFFFHYRHYYQGLRSCHWISSLFILQHHGFRLREVLSKIMENNF